MKKQIALLLWFFGSSLATHAATISLISNSPILAGSTFDVAVRVANVFSGRPAGDLLIAYGFNVSIGDGSLFSYLGETPGALFDDVSALFGGTPMVAGIATDPAGIAPADFSEPLTLTTLHFKALRGGATSIGVTWDSNDLDQGLIFADLPYAPLNATTTLSAVAVPEPSSLLLAGLAVLAAARIAKLR